MASLYLPLMYGRPVPALEQANSQLVVQEHGNDHDDAVTISLYGSQGVKVYARPLKFCRPTLRFGTTCSPTEARRKGVLRRRRGAGPARLPCWP
ncbi:MAG: hypothetical protein U0X20_02080 [Caldilineaceae bacterium]